MNVLNKISRSLSTSHIIGSIVSSVLIAASAAGQLAWADDISLGVPAYGGNGCPSGTASASLSPDNKQLSILFDQFSAEAGGQTGKRVDRKTCNLAIPVHVPQGFSMSVIQVDYRGYNSVPEGARSQFNVEYFFAGSRGPKSMRTFTGPLDEDYTINNTLGVAAIVWSACGADTILRANASMTAQSNMFGEQVLSTVDSADISAGIVYKLQWKRCN